MSDLDIWGDPKKQESDAEGELWGDFVNGPVYGFDDEGEEIDSDAPSSETNSGIERDWAAGYGRGQ